MALWPFAKKKQQQMHSGQFGPHFQQAPQPVPFPVAPPQGNQENWFEEQPEFEGQLAVDVYQTDHDIVLKAPVAGVTPEDIDITITDDVITVKGERKLDPNIPQEAYFSQECYYGPFSRSIILPIPVSSEEADATFKNGILIITIPKAEKARTKTLRIKTD